MAMPRSSITLAKLRLNFRGAERSAPHQSTASEMMFLPIDHDGGDYTGKEERSIMIDDLESMTDSDAGQSIMIDDLDNVKLETGPDEMYDKIPETNEKVDDEIRLDLQYVDKDGKLTLECFYPAVELPQYPVTAAQIRAAQLHYIRTLALKAVNVALIHVRYERNEKRRYVELEYRDERSLFPVRDREDVREAFTDMMGALGFGTYYSVIYSVGQVKIFW